MVVFLYVLTVLFVQFFGRTFVSERTKVLNGWGIKEPQEDTVEYFVRWKWYFESCTCVGNSSADLRNTVDERSVKIKANVLNSHTASSVQISKNFHKGRFIDTIVQKKVKS